MPDDKMQNTQQDEFSQSYFGTSMTGFEALESNDKFLATLEDNNTAAQVTSGAAKSHDVLLLAETEVLYGVRFSRIGQVSFFPAASIKAAVGSVVLVEFEYGQMLGEVISVIDAANPPASLELGEGSVLALATAQDIATHTENRLLAAEAEAFCKSCTRQRGLDMKLVGVEVLHDRSKIIFFFTAPTRIDFRELVKDLVRNYRTRIELRQIGVRHEAQMVGGIGNCGMVCCCHKYLRKFAPVTIKMAKEQNLFLNPAKLSGLCGRLLCCLSFEQGNYEEFHSKSPKIGKRYLTKEGIIRIARTNMFSCSIVGITEANAEVTYSFEEWEALEPKRHDAPSEAKKQPVAAQNDDKRNPADI